MRELLLSMVLLGLTLYATDLMGQCDREQVINDYNNIYLATEFDLAELNWSGDAAACDEGTFATSVAQKFLDRINYFRRMCSLNDDVVFDSAKNQKCQEAALMQSANGSSLSHCTGNNGAPCDQWPCSTPDAIQASQSSNLASGNWDVHNPIFLYMRDDGNSNVHVGHRRWLLHSKATTFGLGLTEDRNAIWVFGNSGNTPMNDLDYIAYPPADYIIQDLVFDRWSFGIPGGDFTNASVSMTDQGGNSIPTTIIYSASVGYGDYTLVWEPVGIDVTNSLDISYDVTVSGIGGAAPLSSYSYTVKVVPNIYPPLCPTGQQWNETVCECQEEGLVPDSLNVSGLISGEYLAENILMCSDTIDENFQVSFKSCGFIALDAGFATMEGVTFEATTDAEHCNENNVLQEERLQQKRIVVPVSEVDMSCLEESK